MLKNKTFNIEDLNISESFVFRFCKYEYKKDFIGSILLCPWIMGKLLSELELQIHSEPKSSNSFESSFDPEYDN